jgi:hypothetical protein
MYSQYNTVIHVTSILHHVKHVLLVTKLKTASKKERQKLHN